MLALALTTGVVSAFAFAIPKTNGTLQTTYYFTKAGFAPYTGTQALAEANYSCAGGSTICAKAYTTGSAHHRASSGDIFQP